jgi:hypothetical protein
MTIEDINNALGENKVTQAHITTAQVANIMMYVPVIIDLDRGTFEHHYTIFVDDLLESNMPVSDLDDLKSQGWAFNEDREKLIVYLKV